MMISPVIFCTIVLGIGSIRQAAKVGKVGGLALRYFLTMSTAALAIGLASHRPDLVDGVGIIVGIDRFMSEARAVTNFAGNAVATVLIGSWVGEFDRAKADRVLAGEDPFAEASMIDDDEPAATPEETRLDRPPAGAQA